MSTTRKHLESCWRQYAERVLPKGARPVQLQETRRAFYAGAGMVLNRLIQHMSPGDEITASDEQLLRGIQAEMDQFLADVVAGRK